MARSSYSNSPDQASTVRNLKRLVALLVVSNIALGFFSVYLLRSVDQRYSELVGRSVPAINDLQTLTAGSVEAMRGTGSALSGAPVEKREEVLRSSRAAVQRDHDARNELLKRDWLSSSPNGKSDFQKAGEAFNRIALDVLKLFADGKLAESIRLREEALRPAFDRYVAATTRMADLLEAESRRASAEYTAKTGSLSAIVLGVAGWPVIAMAVLALVVLVLVVGMMVVFRGKDLADAP